MRPLAGIPKIGALVDGTIIEVVSRIGVIVDINAAYAAFLPAEEFGKRIKRPRKGYRLVSLEVVDVDLDAEEPQKIVLGGQQAINLTPSPLLVTPTSSCLGSPEVSRRSSPEPSRPPSPELNAAASPLLAACAEHIRRVSPAPSRRISPPPSRRTSPIQSRGPSPVTSRRTSPTPSGCTSPVPSFQPLPPILEPEPLLLPPSLKDLADRNPPGLVPADALPREHAREVPQQRRRHEHGREETLPREHVREAPQHSQRQRAHEPAAEEALPRERAPEAPQHSQRQRAHEPVAEEAPRRGRKTIVEPLRIALLGRAVELGLSRAQLRPALRCLDVLEMQLAVAEKAKELGVPTARLRPVLRSLDGLCEPAVPAEPEPAQRKVRLRPHRCDAE